ncbi:MAG: MerR family transcriptional regulator [Hyphomicrobiaceae bacterium]
MTNPTATLSIGELAKFAGVTVRALRHYERSGLIAAVRAENGRRVFTRSDIKPLKLIVALKRIGLTLAECKQVLAQDSAAFAEVVNNQLQALARKKENLEWSIAALTAAGDRTKRGGSLDTDTLIDVIVAAEELRVLPHDPRVSRYYDKSQIVRLHRRRPGRNRQKEIHAEWMALIREIEALAISGDPLAAEAQRAAVRLSEFEDNFARGEADIIDSLRRQEKDAAAYYAHVPDEEAAVQATPSSLSKRGWLFISRALEAYRKTV